MALASPAQLPRHEPRKAEAPPAAGFLTSEQFLDWLQPGVRADLIDGKTARHSPVSLKHARLLNFLDALLRGYVEAKDLGEVHRESVAVRLSVRETFLPDLAWFTRAQVGRILETHAPLAPAFVVEVLSPATAERDRGAKFAAYERHGVQEYWLLDPDGLDHRFHRRAGELLEEFAAGQARFESASLPGFWVRREWLDPARPPRVADCLRELLRPARRRTRP
jgi:Uma2 family endonuclease